MWYPFLVTEGLFMWKFIYLLYDFAPGIAGVPTFEIYLPEQPEVKQSFSGAQPVDTFVAVFSRVKAMAKM